MSVQGLVATARLAATDAGGRFPWLGMESRSSRRSGGVPEGRRGQRAGAMYWHESSNGPSGRTAELESYDHSNMRFGHLCPGARGLLGFDEEVGCGIEETAISEPQRQMRNRPPISAFAEKKNRSALARRAHARSASNGRGDQCSLPRFQEGAEATARRPSPRVYISHGEFTRIGCVSVTAGV